MKRIESDKDKEIYNKYKERFCHFYYLLSRVDYAEDEGLIFPLEPNNGRILFEYINIGLNNFQSGYYPGTNMMILDYELNRFIRTEILTEEIKSLYIIKKFLI